MCVEIVLEIRFIVIKRHAVLLERFSPTDILVFAR
jgi:hypothetical protein